MDPQEAFVAFSGTVLGVGLAALAIVCSFRHQRRKRELEHIERIRALDLGRTLPQDEPWLSPAKIGALIAVVVPIGVFVPAWIVTLADGYHEMAWIAAVMVGVAAVICGSILVASSIRKEAATSASSIDKPYVEEDAYDVVASRG